MNIIVMILLLAVIGIYFIGFAFNLRALNSSNGKLFNGGEVPNPIPNGFHKGSVKRFQGTWQGKKFDPKNFSGINIFNDDGKQVEKYPFKLYLAKKVLKIDYNIPANPFWVRFILDESVEIKDPKNNYYLGKLNLMLPLYPVALGYFRLEK